MSKPSARNEGIFPLEEFVCQAIPNPAAFPEGIPRPQTGRGRDGAVPVSPSPTADVAAQPVQGPVSPAREAELHSLPTQQLLAIVTGMGQQLPAAELQLIRTIAEERLARHTADANGANELLAACRQAGQFQ